eukprot:Skav236128  [mRNA]  locus=scaffold900:368879:380005:- [translate_table: standard]
MGRVCGAKRAGGASGSMEDVLCWVESRLEPFNEIFRRVKPMGGVFPLPFSSARLTLLFPDVSPSGISCLRCVVVSLNSLYGVASLVDFEPNKLQRRVLQELWDNVERVLNWEERSPEVTWNSFFRVKGVDYKGDEVCTAQRIQWENVCAALPSEVGSVDLADVVELGSLQYTLNFEDYLLHEEDQVPVRPPRVMVQDEHWEKLCSELLKRGVFAKVHEDDVYQVGGKRLLNGLFGVSKNEFDEQGWEVMRIIMNLIPLNEVCRTLESDVSTLPSWAGMSPLELHVTEDLVISSEDVRCFFYIFKVPLAWHRFMAFNKPLPDSLKGDKPGVYYPCSAVLPMGFKNSVALAQHIHRFLVKNALNRCSLGSEGELRKDKSFPRTSNMFRVYLDNFDELRKVSKGHADALAGKVSPLVTSLREEYASRGIPRHPKKAVSSKAQAEVQGAIMDGNQGIAFPKPEKVLKYAILTQLLIESGECTQKQAQVVGGGLVYLAMFRRPLLGALNHIWTFITSFEGYPPVVRLPVPREVTHELVRFLGLIPLAFLDFRCTVSPFVTASDASTTGGGVTVSQGVTHAGSVAAQCTVRGDVVEPTEVTQVLTIGLFDGIGGLRAACDALGWNVVGHVSIEQNPHAARVVESRFPNTFHVSDVALVDLEMVKDWSLRFSQVGLVMIGAGPPCQGVSGLNASRKGALKDARSSLFSHVGRIRSLVQRFFPWAQVKSLMESVASMDLEDQDVMTQHFGEEPRLLDSADVSLAHRPRLYWFDWEIPNQNDVEFVKLASGRVKVKLSASVDPADYLEPGWQISENHKLPTFTTSRPQSKPGYKPAGIKQCRPHELSRWEADKYRFPPYQYQDVHCLFSKKGDLRVATCEEREVIMGYPKGYTVQCFPKSQQGSEAHSDCRLSLIGNSWNITTVAWLLSQVGALLGLNDPLSPQDIVARTAPGCVTDFQSFLLRPSMKVKRLPRKLGNDLQLVQKFLTQISLKGDDLLLKATSEDQVRYQRLRASIPANLWRWKTVTGWTWSSPEHINVLELRAALTAIKWRIEKKHETAKKKVEHMPKRHLEASTQAERAKERKKLGTLKELTVQPTTRARYKQALEDFFKYLQQEAIQLPTVASQLDLVVSDYLEFLWAQGFGRATASNILAALQDSQPHLKGKLAQSWRLLRAWVANEIPNRAPPLPLDVLHAMVGYALFKQQAHMALTLLVAFHGLLRTGELLNLQNRHVTISGPKGPAVLSLGLTKSGKRQGAAESVTIYAEDVCRRLFQWKQHKSPHSFLAGPKHVWRKQFAAILQALKFDSWDFRPYSLRRGGATEQFKRHGAFDQFPSDNVTLALEQLVSIFEDRNHALLVEAAATGTHGNARERNGTTVPGSSSTVVQRYNGSSPEVVHQRSNAAILEFYVKLTDDVSNLSVDLAYAVPLPPAEDDPAPSDELPEEILAMSIAGGVCLGRGLVAVAVMNAVEPSKRVQHLNYLESVPLTADAVPLLLRGHLLLLQAARAAPPSGGSGGWWLLVVVVSGAESLVAGG